MTAAVVTAWRDHPELATDYFAAIDAANPDQLVVVDDGSDPALEFAAARIDAAGFSTANNAGLALVETDIVVFVNNDVVMVRDSWLAELVDQVEAGVVCGPLRFDPHGNVDDTPYPYVDGWCLAMLTRDAHQLGGWDEAYDQAGPAYFSDNAFSFQARMAGMKLREVRPGLRHLGGRTGGGGPAFEAAFHTNEQLFKRQVRETLQAATR